MSVGGQYPIRRITLLVSELDELDDELLELDDELLDIDSPLHRGVAAVESPGPEWKYGRVPLPCLNTRPFCRLQ